MTGAVQRGCSLFRSWKNNGCRSVLDIRLRPARRVQVHACDVTISVPRCCSSVHDEDGIGNRRLAAVLCLEAHALRRRLLSVSEVSYMLPHTSIIFYKQKQTSKRAFCNKCEYVSKLTWLKKTKINNTMFQTSTVRFIFNLCLCFYWESKFT